MGKKYNKTIDEFMEITDMFISFSEAPETFNNFEMGQALIEIYNSIVFESKENERKSKINYLIFWLNKFIQNFRTRFSKELKVSIISILDTLNLQQLISYIDIKNEDLDIQKYLSKDIRCWFDDRILSDAQFQLFEKVLDNENIVFSAPTSYGKTSVMINSLVVHSKIYGGKNYIFILPTKALINEYRVRIIYSFGNDFVGYEINENPFYKRDKDIIVFHLLTQERFLMFSEMNRGIKCDYIVFDEAQSLINIKKEDQERSVILAKCVSLADNNKMPMIFLMPYVANPLKDVIEKFVNEQTSFYEIADLFSPTSSNKYLITFQNKSLKCLDVTLNKGYAKIPQERLLMNSCNENIKNFYDLKNILFLITEALGINNEKTLCYCKKDEISKTAHLYTLKKLDVINDARCKALINYISKYIHPNFEMINFLKKGIAIHHGDLDTYTKRQIEKIFANKDSNLNMIFCTSTLLEGVNLNAQNLLFLAQRGSFTNNVLDKKNLFGRVGRLGSYLQGNIFKFWVDGQREHIDNIVNELNTLNDEYVVEHEKLDMNNINEKNELLNTYFEDEAVKSRASLAALKKGIDTSNFDYFIGKKKSKIVEEKLGNFTAEQNARLEELLQLKSANACKEIMHLLCVIYDWSNSNNFDEKYRMTNYEYIGYVLFDYVTGMPISKVLNDLIAKHKKRDEYVLIILEKSDGEEYPKMVRLDSKYKTYENYKREFKDSDINLLVYSYIYEIQNIIDFRVKKYLQDLYYRLIKKRGKSIESVEDFLIYNTINNQRKISLNNIGLLDSFAIDEISKIDELFKNDLIQIAALKEYGHKLSLDDPLRYAILDVFQ